MVQGGDQQRPNQDPRAQRALQRGASTTGPGVMCDTWMAPPKPCALQQLGPRGRTTHRAAMKASPLGLLLAEECASP